MTRLEENLEVCRKAIASTKADVPRSANQTYFKLRPSDRGNGKKRRGFLLGITRTADLGSDLTPSSGSIPSQRRLQVEAVLKSGATPKSINCYLDRVISEWGEDYFWEKGSCSRSEAVLSRLHRNPKDLEALRAVAKVVGCSTTYLWGLEKNNPAAWKQVEDKYRMRADAQDARQTGVGNCGEKASLVAEYLFDYSPGGKKLASCSLENSHKGFTGKLVALLSRDEGAGDGDHAFCVYDLIQPSRHVGAWGENAVIVDGWMNDCYPAKHFLAHKYMYNYKNEHINIAQMHIRNMICVSYRGHIETEFCWDLKAGSRYKAA